MKTLNLENIFTAAFTFKPNAIQEFLIDELTYPNGQFDSVRNLIRHLEAAACAHGSWSGLIYTRDIQDKLADQGWRDAIDSALEEYSDATGESYTPKSPYALEELVTFAVDWYASDFARALQSEADMNGVYVVTIAEDSLDPSPERIAFFGEYEAQEYISESLMHRMDYIVQHSPYSIGEEEHEALQEQEMELIRMEEESV